MKTKFFITTKADLATEKVNQWLEENAADIDIRDIRPFMSYTCIGASKGAYMIGCMVIYEDSLRAILSRNNQPSL